MDIARSAGTRYTLWHLPSSTPLLTSDDRPTLVALVARLLAEAVPPSHLLLQEESAAGSLGPQWTGEALRAVLRSDDLARVGD